MMLKVKHYIRRLCVFFDVCSGPFFVGCLWVSLWSMLGNLVARRQKNAGTVQIAARFAFRTVAIARNWAMSLENDLFHPVAGKSCTNRSVNKI